MNGFRTAQVRRETSQTLVEVDLTVEGSGKYMIESPIGFLTHMLESFAKHGRFDLNVSVQGDLDVDQHHTLEDTGAALGEAFEQALGNRLGINRAGCFVFPMDEAVAFAAVDICKRSYLKYDVPFSADVLGGLRIGLLHDFFEAFSAQLKCNLHIHLPYGRSDHHKAEAVFKAWGKAMRMACSMDPRDIRDTPSVKEVF